MKQSLGVVVENNFFPAFILCCIILHLILLNTRTLPNADEIKSIVETSLIVKTGFQHDPCNGKHHTSFSCSATLTS